MKKKNPMEAEEFYYKDIVFLKGHLQKGIVEDKE